MSGDSATSPDGGGGEGAQGGGGGAAPGAATNAGASAGERGLSKWQSYYAQEFAKKLSSVVGDNVGKIGALPFYDVILSVERGGQCSGEFAAHKLILASHSRSFDRMFKSGSNNAGTTEPGQPQRVVLKGPNVDEESLLAMLKIFYFVEDVSSQLSRSPDLILRLMALAKELTVQEVLVECHNYIRYELNDPKVLEHVVEQLRFTEGQGAPVYKECNEKLRMLNEKLKAEAEDAEDGELGRRTSSTSLTGAIAKDPDMEPKGRWGANEDRWVTPLRCSMGFRA